MHRLNILFLSLFSVAACHSQTGSNANKASSLQRPKLVIGIVVDQMRWDYLYRYHDRYAADGGFKRMLDGGFSCENTMIPYVPTLTACGHTCIYTGSVPAIHGITGNDWFDNSRNEGVYCTEDNSVNTVGSSTDAGKMSPRNLLTTTICDELKLATNFRSKVVGIAIKDRGAILPAGHSADGAYWYDNETGDFISSSYYKSELPGWVHEFNAKKLPDVYYKMNWNTLYPVPTYVQSAPATKDFPISLKQFAGSNYKVLPATPHGNSFTFEMAKAAIKGESLGADSVTDMLAVSLSSPDYIGHANGPNSIEAEDCFLKLDRDLGAFLSFVESQVGKGNYLVFLSADHGAAHMPSFLRSHKIPAGNFDTEIARDELDALLKEKFKVKGLLIDISNYQVFLNRHAMEENKIDRVALNKTVISYLQKNKAVQRAFVLEELNSTLLSPKVKEAVANGYYPGRSGDIQIIMQPQWIDGFINGGTTHGVWNAYDAHIPLLWYGWNIAPGKTNRETYMTDIAPTVAALLRIQMPSGTVGHAIEEVTKDPVP